MTRLADALQRANRQNQMATAAAATAVATPDSEPAPEAMAAKAPPAASAASAMACVAPVLSEAPVAPAAPMPRAAPVVAAPAARVAPAAPAPVAPRAPVAPAARVAAVAAAAPATIAAAPNPSAAAARPATMVVAPSRPAPKRVPDWSRVAAAVETPAVEKRAAPALPTGSSLIAAPASTDQLTLWRTDPEVAGKLVGTDGFLPAAMEQYRKLGAILHHAQVERGVKVIMTSSAMPGEGKSLTSVNLALTLSDSYRKRVLLIDVDLRRPTVQRIFGLPPVGGLTEALTAPEDRQIAITRVSESLFVMPAGRPESDPMSGLTSDRMKRVFAQAASQFDFVIVDSPPVGLLPDASLLATLVDGVLLVIRSGKAPFPLVKRAVEVVTHQRILGVVMNAIDFKHDRNAGGYYEYYGAGYYGTPSNK